MGRENSFRWRFKNIQSLLDFLLPITFKQFKRFLGFVNYCRDFIRNHSITVKPLHCLLTKYHWTSSVDSYNGILQMTNIQGYRERPPSCRRMKDECEGRQWIWNQKIIEFKRICFIYISMTGKMHKQVYRMIQGKTIVIQAAANRFGVSCIRERRTAAAEIKFPAREPVSSRVPRTILLRSISFWA